jgi:UDP-N-acetylmuramyl pentapeptide phosphotransferase/UDP-N-acetylglucosamine-1-phosphate transferase
MDGLDLMMVAEFVPITGTLIVLGVARELPAATDSDCRATLCGAILGFAPSNRPVAKVFLGDVGSLPIGLLLGWCLLQLAWYQQLVAALLLPLYYLTDATLTLLRRMTRRARPSMRSSKSRPCSRTLRTFPSSRGRVISSTYRRAALRSRRPLASAGLVVPVRRA